MTATAERVATVLQIPLHRFLGVRLLEPDHPERGIAFDVAEPTLSNAGVLHGGVVTALLDVACYLALLAELGPEEHAVTHDITASLVRSVPQGAEVHLTGTVVRRGSRLAFLRAEATVDGQVVATAQVTKSLVPVRS